MSAANERAFSETSDPSAYVPREATEVALDALRSWAATESSGPTVAALSAAPGLGKTFMLRLLESRLERGRSVERRSARALYLPYAGLGLPDLRDWVTGLLAWPMRAVASERATGVSSRSPEPTGVVAETSSRATEASSHAAEASSHATETSSHATETSSHATEAESEAARALADLVRLARDVADPLVLLIDDADSMPAQTVRALVEALPREGSPLRILMALGADARSSRLLAAFDALDPLEVRLERPMSEEETAAYVRGRLRWADAEPPGGLDASDLQRIHGLSGGVPRQVHRVAASALAHDAGDRPSDLDSKLRREDWMGRPLDDDL